LGRNRHLERAAAEAERHELVEPGAALEHLVAAGHGRLDGAVDRPRGHVLGPGEEHLDVPLRALRVERAAVALELEAGAAHQVEHRVVQAALGRQRQAEAAAHRRFVLRSSTSRYPPSPCRSQCATRVTVVVEPRTRWATWAYGTPWSSRRAACQRWESTSSSWSEQTSRRNAAASSRERRRSSASQRSSTSAVRQLASTDV